MCHVPLAHQDSGSQWSEEKSKSANISCCSAVRKKGVCGGVSTGFRRVNSSSKLLTSLGALMFGRNGGFTRLASKVSQSTPCAVTKLLSLLTWFIISRIYKRCVLSVQEGHLKEPVPFHLVSVLLSSTKTFFWVFLQQLWQMEKKNINFLNHQAVEKTNKLELE